MSEVTTNNQIKIVRPFLKLEKQQLIQYCKDRKISFANDPTNEKEEFLRPRLRQSMTILQEEGLSKKRISSLIDRLDRAKEALNNITQESAHKIEKARDKSHIYYDWKQFQALHDEIAFRVLKNTIEEFRPDQNYHVRMEKVEDLFQSLRHQQESFKPRTLGGCIIRVDQKNNELIIQKEK